MNAFKSSSSKLLKWNTLTEWLVRSNNNFKLMMLIGPRWNCHAIIGVTDIFEVRDCLWINMRDMIRSAKYWTIVIYDQKFNTIKYIGSSMGINNEDWRKVDLSPGNYILGLRYYEITDEVHFPMIKVDGIEKFDRYNVKSEKKRYNDYLMSLGTINALYYTVVHFHAYIYLKYQERFRKRFINSLYLPVGNPETDFMYGSVTKGQILNIKLPNIKEGVVYLTIYNTASLPVYWEKIIDTKDIIVTSSGTYLIRFISDSLDGLPADLKVNVL